MRSRSGGRLVLTLLVRDEEDVIEDNLDFHLQHGVDHILVTDNNSVDRTPDILRSWSQQTGQVEVWNESGNDYAQSEWVSRMACYAAEDLGADWVINADADEFWWPKSGSLRSTLLAEPPSVAVLRCRVLEFVARRTSRPESISEMVVRERRSAKVKVAHRANSNIVVAMGNHAVLFPDMPTRAAGRDIEVLHFPNRSYQQFERKVRNGGSAVENNPLLPPDVCAHWRRLLVDYESGALEQRYRTDYERSVSEVVKGLASGQLTFDARLRRWLRRRHADRPSPRW